MQFYRVYFNQEWMYVLIMVIFIQICMMYEDLFVPAQKKRKTGDSVGDTNTDSLQECKDSAHTLQVSVNKIHGSELDKRLAVVSSKLMSNK